MGYIPIIAFILTHKVLPHKDIRADFAGKNLTKFSRMNLVRKLLIRLMVKEELESAVVSMSSVKIFTTAPLPTVGLRLLWLENDLSHGCSPLDQGMCRHRVRQRHTSEDVWFDLTLAQ